MITIAIPFYNAEQFLGKAIESVINQSYTDWKLILVDDGSTDSSLEIAHVYAKKDPRISIFSDGMNKNLGYRLNQIPALVTTKYLARMDADDIMHPDRLKKQLAILENHPEIDVLGTNAYTIDESGKIIGLRFILSDTNKLQKVMSFIHPTVMAKTSWFKENLYDVNAVRIEDAELWYRTKTKYLFMITNEPLLYYREIGTDYYKKYFLANISKRYILEKYPNSVFWRVFFISNTIKGIIYRFFNLFDKEQLLVDRRNEQKY
ncbi:glycosyltransferase family 2 protein [Riemerella anatipestifer]|uniref:Putative glycosyltransferase EpsE n=1 Tax=Riemerella anatipestifer TaxID=34085 RepID=A0A1S7DR54_RIEAN|nr:glycosyltransferase family 2 protein [Riemerella anatipestifer]AQY21603.1 Putative glycosyltransferase EpsE [Riemerella anatipestifer]OBP63998.1 glycosyl transferase family 2 [Riemerella anatipestifer]